jgi:hypothetical protein
MSKFWGWLKSFFVKAQPIIATVEPVAITIAEAANPKLIPALDAAQAAIAAAKGVANKTA